MRESFANKCNTLIYSILLILNKSTIFLFITPHFLLASQGFSLIVLLMDTATQKNIRLKVAARNALATIFNQNIERFRSLVGEEFCEGDAMTTKTQNLSAKAKKVWEKGNGMAKELNREIELIGFPVRLRIHFSFSVSFGHFRVNVSARDENGKEHASEGRDINEQKNGWLENKGRDVYSYVKLYELTPIKIYDAEEVINGIKEIEVLEAQIRTVKDKVGFFMYR